MTTITRGGMLGSHFRKTFLVSNENELKNVWEELLLI
jgi:hypothetical protein